MLNQKSIKHIYKARVAGIDWAEIARVYGVSTQGLHQYAIAHGVWNKLENRRLKGLDRLKKAVSEG